MLKYNWGFRSRLRFWEGEIIKCKHSLILKIFSEEEKSFVKYIAIIIFMERLGPRRGYTNLEVRGRVGSCSRDGWEQSLLIIGNAVGLALDHNQGSEQGIELQGLNIGLLPDGPLSRPKRVFPAHMVPVVHVVRQYHHRPAQLEIPPPQPRKQQLRLRRRLATLRREQLHHHRRRRHSPYLLGPRLMVSSGRFIVGLATSG